MPKPTPTVLAALMMLVPISARAQNASSLGTPELYSTYQALGVRVPYSGDANGNATARVDWRLKGTTAWNTGVSMTRISSSRWAASVLWLSPGTSYDVRTVVTDADGGGSVTATASTRLPMPATATGHTWWVATNGSDANFGSQTSPFATLQTAASRSQPGDQIRVKPGIYYQTLDTPVSGTVSAPIHLVADAPGVRIDGSDPAYLKRSDWRSDGGGVYSVPYTPTSNRVVCADSLQRLYLQASLAALQAGANGINQGFAIEGGRLYVKLEDGSSPAGHTMHVARSNVGLLIDNSYWHVSGLEVRYFGTGSGGSAIQLAGGTGNWITGNHIHTFGGRGVYIVSGSWNNLVEKNLVRDPRVGTWPWDATKSHMEEITGISNRGGRGNVISANTVTGCFDGLDANSGAGDENVAADADYYDNTVTACGDDAIETDTVSGLNLRLWNNIFDGNYGGISLAPIYQGPEYILFNQITNYRRGGFKFSNTSTGQAWICHNTVRSSVSGKPSVWPSGPYSNMRFMNNILVGNGIGTVNDDAGESQTGNDFNGDLLYSTGGTLFRWKDSNYSTLSALRSGTGFEQSGRAGDPLFVSATGGVYTLLVGSPAIDGAIRLPGINDRFVGAAPDMGKFERGLSVGVDDPPGQGRPGVEEVAMRIAPPRPNPSRGPALLTFSISRESHVALRVYDLSGRMVRELADQDFPAGDHGVEWDGRDGGGRDVGTGVYLARLESAGSVRTTRIVRVR